MDVKVCDDSCGVPRATKLQILLEVQCVTLGGLVAANKFH